MIPLIRAFHSVLATARVALNTSTVLISRRLRALVIEVSLLVGCWRVQAVSAFCTKVGWLSFSWIIACAWACAATSKVFLAMQCIESDSVVRDMEFAKQLLCGGNLVGLLVDLDMRQDQTKFGVPRVKPKGRLPNAEVGLLCGL